MLKEKQAMKTIGDETQDRSARILDLMDDLSRTSRPSMQTTLAFIAVMEKKEDVALYLDLAEADDVLRASDSGALEMSESWIVEKSRSKRNPKRVALPLVACLVALVAGVSWWSLRDSGWEHHKIALGPAQMIILDSGTQMNVYGGSSFGVRQSDSQLEVLIEDGGAQFEASGTSARQLTVSVKGGTLTPVHPQTAHNVLADPHFSGGMLHVQHLVQTSTITAFNVLRKGNETGVFVFSGNLRMKGLGEAAAKLLSPGDSVALSDKGIASPVTTATHQRERLWNGGTLEELAAALNSYNTVPQIAVTGAARSRRLGGSVSMTTPRDLVAALDALGGYRFEQSGNTIVIGLARE